MIIASPFIGMHITGVPHRVRLILAFLAFLAVVPSSMGCSDCNLEIITGALPDGIVGTAYSFDLQSFCGGDTWFLYSGNLPPGIGLTDDGDLRGTPTLPGIFAFTIAVVNDNTWDTALKGLALTIHEAQ